jgi:hypothetical protein
MLKLGGKKADVQNDLQRGFIFLVDDALAEELESLLEGSTRGEKRARHNDSNSSKKQESKPKKAKKPKREGEEEGEEEEEKEDRGPKRRRAPRVQQTFDPNNLLGAYNHQAPSVQPQWQNSGNGQHHSASESDSDSDDEEWGASRRSKARGRGGAKGGRGRGQPKGRGNTRNGRVAKDHRPASMVEETDEAVVKEMVRLIAKFGAGNGKRSLQVDSTWVSFEGL